MPRTKKRKYTRKKVAPLFPMWLYAPDSPDGVCIARVEKLGLYVVLNEYATFGRFDNEVDAVLYALREGLGYEVKTFDDFLTTFREATNN